MKLIAHRGNTKGPSGDLENSPQLIERAVKLGYDVEVDVWYIDETFWLGHDKPTFQMGSYWLYHPKLWRHAKNLPALRKMLDAKVHCFWHENDERTLTSHGYVWTYTGKEYDDHSVIVNVGPIDGEIPNVYGICSDYVEFIKLPGPPGSSVPDKPRAR